MFPHPSSDKINMRVWRELVNERLAIQESAEQALRDAQREAFNRAADRVWKAIGGLNTPRQSEETIERLLQDMRNLAPISQLDRESVF